MEGQVLAPQATLMVHTPGDRKLSREELGLVPCPEGTATHRPVPHIQLVTSVLEGLAMRQINVISDEYAISEDGMKMFGMLDLASSAGDFRFAIGIRNSHDKSMSLGMVAGMRVFVCSNMSFSGDFVAIAKKHTKNLDIMDSLAVGIDRIHRSFNALTQQVERWKGLQLTDDRAKSIMFDAFFGPTKLDCPQHLIKAVRDNYFEPKYPEFEPRTFYSLQNSFTSSFKELEPMQQFRATASLGKFIQ